MGQIFGTRLKKIPSENKNEKQWRLILGIKWDQDETVSISNVLDETETEDNS